MRTHQRGRCPGSETKYKDARDHDQTLALPPLDCGLPAPQSPHLSSEKKKAWEGVAGTKWKASGRWANSGDIQGST